MEAKRQIAPDGLAPLVVNTGEAAEMLGCGQRGDRTDGAGGFL
jgi:hypothetical protein